MRWFAPAVRSPNWFHSFAGSAPNARVDVTFPPIRAAAMCLTMCLQDAAIGDPLAVSSARRCPTAISGRAAVYLLPPAFYPPATVSDSVLASVLSAFRKRSARPGWARPSAHAAVGKCRCSRPACFLRGSDAQLTVLAPRSRWCSCPCC